MCNCSSNLISINSIHSLKFFSKLLIASTSFPLLAAFPFIAVIDDVSDFCVSCKRAFRECSWYWHTVHCKIYVERRRSLEIPCINFRFIAKVDVASDASGFAAL